MSDRPKRQLTEEQLKRLADARKKAIESLKKKGELNKAKKAELKEQREKEYEEKVLKKKSPPKKEEAPLPQIEETDKDIYENNTPTPPKNEGSDDDDYPVEIVQRSKAKTKKASQSTAPNEPNYKQMYYQHKLNLLQAKQQEQDFYQQYARLPTYQHTVDIAKHQIRERVDKAVYDNIYSQLFSGGL